MAKEVVEVRPQVLECDVVSFQNNKEKWVALVGLLDGYPYEIFTGLQDEEEGIMLPKSVSKGKSSSKSMPTAPSATTSSLRIHGDIRLPSRVSTRSSTPNTGTMPS